MIIMMMSITMLYSQTQLSGKKICIDPGHGGHESDDRENPLTNGTGTYWESDWNFTRGFWIETMLKDLGATVKLTRTLNGNGETTGDPTLSQRVATANAFACDHFHSIHSNAGGGTANYTVCIFKGSSNTAPTWTEGKRMSDLMTIQIYNVVRTTTKYSWADVPFAGFSLGVLNGTNMPASLSETAMHDYEAEKMRLMNDMYQKGTCWAIVRSFVQFWSKPALSVGELEGIVKDASGNPMNNIKVTLQPGSKSYTGDGYGNGCYGFDKLAAGSYTITFNKTGYKTVTKTVTVAANQYNRLDQTMETGTSDPVVVLTAPTDGATGINNASVEFRWTAFTGATSYTLQVASDANFTSYIYNQSVGNVTTKTIANLNQNTKYYWKVNSNVANSESIPSQFTTAAIVGVPFVALWQKADTTKNTPSWFSTTGNTERGVAYSNNKLYVVSRNSGLNIRVMDWYRGKDLWQVNTTGVSGGTYALNDIEADWDENLLACNLTTNAQSDPFKIYLWKHTFDENGKPEHDTLMRVQPFLTYNSNAYRLGDNFTVHGSLTGEALIYAAVASNNKVLRWSVKAGRIDSTAGNCPKEITLSGLVTPFLGSTPAVAPFGTGEDEDFYVNGTSVRPMQYNSTGATLKGTIPGAVVAELSSSMRMFVIGDKRYLAVLQTNNTPMDPGGQNMRIIDITSGAGLVLESDVYGYTPRLGNRPNLNATGDIAYRADANGNYIFFVLATNNGIGAYWTKNGTLYKGLALDTTNYVNPLPVELTSFSGYINNKNVELVWKTATEVNNYGFEIQRKSVKTGYEKIGFVSGSGNSSNVINYTFTDKAVNEEGKYTYRLKQIDMNGEYEYTKEVEINYTKELKYSLEQNYPNPFNPSTTIGYTVPGGINGNKTNVVIKVYDMLGREVKTLVNESQQSGSYKVRMDGSEIASGMYIYKIQAGNFTKSMKMMFIK